MAWWDKYIDQIEDYYNTVIDVLQPGTWEGRLLKDSSKRNDRSTEGLDSSSRSRNSGTEERDRDTSGIVDTMKDVITQEVIANADMDPYSGGLGNSESPYNTNEGVILGNYVGELTPSEVAQMNFNHNESLYQRQFEQYMSNTAYQRVVADMQAAGINPAMAWSNGAASTPQGSAATSSAGARGSLDLLGILSSLFLGSKSLDIQNKVADSQIKLNEAAANKTNTEIPWIDVFGELESLLKKENIAYVHSNIDLNKQQLENLGVFKDKMLEEIALLKKDAAYVDKQVELATAEALFKTAQKWQIYKLTPAMEALYQSESSNQSSQAAWTNWQKELDRAIKNDPITQDAMKEAIRAGSSKLGSEAIQEGVNAELAELMRHFDGSFNDLGRAFFLVLSSLPGFSIPH